MLHGILAILAATSPQRDTLPQLDTAFVVARRLSFGSIGRFQHFWTNTDNSNQGLSQFLSQNGVFLKQYGVSGIATISRRGADPQQTQVLWNGLPVANAMLGMPDLNTMFLFGSKEIILTDGGNASVYGSGSVGGTLQLNHGRSADTGLSASLVSSAGSFGKFSNSADFSLNKNKSWIRAQGSLSKAKNNFYYTDLVQNEWQKMRMQNAQTRFINGRLQGGSQIKNTSFRGIAEWSSANRNLGMVIGSPLYQGSQADHNARFMVESVSKMKKITSTNRIGYTRDQIIYQDTAHSVNDTSLASVKHLQTEWYFSIGECRILTGGDIQWQQGQANTYSGIKNRIYPAQFISAIIPFKKWIFNPGIRFEWHEKIPVYSLSAERKINEFWQLKTNVHNTFRRPTLNDLFWGSAGNQNLKYEQGKGAELGMQFKKETPKFKSENEFCIYGRSLTNAIVWMPQGQVWIPLNMYKGNYTGIQYKFQDDWKIRKGILSLSGSYDFVFSQIFANPNSEARQRIFVPRHAGYMQMGFEISGVKVNTNIAYTGARYTSSDNSESLPGYFIVSANISKSIIKINKYQGVVIFSADNIAGQTYQNMPGKPMPPRSFNFTLILKYKNKK